MYRAVVDLLQPFPLLMLLVLIGVGLLWIRRKESRRRLRLLSASAGLLLLICWPPTAYLALGSLEWQYAPLDRRPAEIPAMVVLAGGAKRVVGQEVVLYPDSIYRCLRAADLYHAGPPCPIYVSGGKVDPSDFGPPLAVLMRDFLIQLAIPAEQIRLEDQSSTTHENAVNTAAMLKQHGIARVVLVTDATHLPRAVQCFEAAGIEVVPAGCSYHADGLSWTLATILPSAGAAGGVQAAAHEWLGLLYYRLSGWI